MRQVDEEGVACAGVLGPGSERRAVGEGERKLPPLQLCWAGGVADEVVFAGGGLSVACAHVEPLGQTVSCCRLRCCSS